MSSFLKKNLLKVAIYIILFFGLFLFIFSPTLNQFKENKKLIATKRAEQITDLDRISSLQKIEKNSIEFGKISETVLGYLPDALSSSQFIVEIEKLARELEIEVSSLSMSESSQNASLSRDQKNDAKKNKSSLYQNQFTITTRAPYVKAVEFLSRMGTLPRVNTITTVDLSPHSDKLLNLKITGNIYYGQ